MKLHSLRLVNYRRFLDATIEFPDGVLAVVGANGSGKSSILEALGFALFGTQATRTAKAQLRHSNAPPGDAVEVTAQLELAGQAIEISRSFRGASLTAKASLTVDGKPLVAGGANSHSAVTQEMERLLGMDRAAFFTSVVAQQKELSRLTDLAANDRKQLILKMLGIDAVDQAIDEARSRRRSAQQRTDDLHESMPAEDLAPALAAAKTTQDQATSNEAEAGKIWHAAQQSLSAATKAAAKAQETAAAHEKAARELAQAKRDLAQATADQERIRVSLDTASRAAMEAAALKDADDLPGAKLALDEARKAHEAAKHRDRAELELNNLRDQLSKLTAQDPGPDTALNQAATTAQSELLAAREQLAAGQATMRQLQAHQAALAGTDAHAPCPFCDQPLDAQLPRLQKSLQDQHESLAREHAALETDANTAQQMLESAQQALQAWQARRQLFEAEVAQRKHLESARDRLTAQMGPPPNLTDLAPLEARLTICQDADRARIRLLAQAEQQGPLTKQQEHADALVVQCLAAVTKAVQALETTPIVDLAPTQLALERATSAERDAERGALAAQNELALAKQAVAHLEERKKEHERLAKALQDARHDLRVWTALAGGRNTGLLEQFRSHLVGKIRPAINHEASRLLSRFTEGRYRELILDEDYGVFVVDEGVPYALERFSGGEADLAHLALRLAVSRLLTRRSGAPELRFLALDEVFGSLDRQRRDAVLAALHGLEDLYSQVVLVTHQEDLREVLDAVLEVRVEGDGSTVHLHHG